MNAYYNENDPKAAAWLRELIKEGLIAPGYVDERSILDVRPHELTDYAQQHFFAGIGGWSYALRLARWPDGRPVRTGSCPCQPFSSAGKRLGAKDERHLWPVFRDLICFGQSTITFGEQIANEDGRAWMWQVRLNLEGMGYEVGCADLCAAGVGAPHPRQRLYWVANPTRSRGRRRDTMEAGAGKESRGSGAVIRPGPWPDGRGGGSSLGVPDVLLPSYGVPHRVAKLHGFGNAIVPQLAAEFIQAAWETLSGMTRKIEKK